MHEFFNEEDYVMTGTGFIRADERVQYSDKELDSMYPFDPIEDNPWTEEDLKALKNQQVTASCIQPGMAL